MKEIMKSRVDVELKRKPFKDVKELVVSSGYLEFLFTKKTLIQY